MGFDGGKTKSHSVHITNSDYVEIFTVVNSALCMVTTSHSCSEHTKHIIK